jgi:hypothetical protein
METSCTGPTDDINVINATAFIHPEHEKTDPATGKVALGPGKTPREIFNEARAQDAPNNPVFCVVNHPMHGCFEGQRLLRECEFMKVFEVSTGNHAPSLKRPLLDLWFELLNKGRRLVAVAGTDTHKYDFYAPGSERVYCRVRGRPTRSKVVRALRDGHSFCTWGPTLVFLRVAGGRPGDTVKVREWPAKLLLSAEVRSLLPVERVDIVLNGDVCWSFGRDDEIRATAPDWIYPVAANRILQAEWKENITLDANGWLLAVAYLRDVEGHVAVTNPVWISGPASAGRAASPGGRS